MSNQTATMIVYDVVGRTVDHAVTQAVNKDVCWSVNEDVYYAINMAVELCQSQIVERPRDVNWFAPIPTCWNTWRVA